jgi:hypothetical protein
VKINLGENCIDETPYTRGDNNKEKVILERE